MPRSRPRCEAELSFSDDTGLFGHARGAVPRREHGYCLDDVARGLLVICREPEPEPGLTALAETYLAFIAHAQDLDGAFHNRLGFDRLYETRGGSGTGTNTGSLASPARGPS